LRLITLSQYSKKLKKTNYSKDDAKYLKKISKSSNKKDDKNEFRIDTEVDNNISFDDLSELGHT
jgi:hypothetical protein